MIEIKSLPVPPEQYEPECLDRIPEDILQRSEMALVERRFINGLVRLARPRVVLEIGVSQGAGSAVLLNALADDPESFLISCDVRSHYYKNSKQEVGWAARAFSENNNPRWELLSGRDLIDRQDMLKKHKGKIDFCVIDTGHIHPTESVNFLTVLPYLADDAIVVVQDTALFNMGHLMHNRAACKILLDTVVADKLAPQAYYTCYDSRSIPNLEAFQVGADTKKYVGNVFRGLRTPWGMQVPFQLGKLHAFFKDTYGEEYATLFWQAYNVSIETRGYMRASARVAEQVDALLSGDEKLILYGGGVNARLLSYGLRHIYNRQVDEVWDKEPSYPDIDGVPVQRMEERLAEGNLRATVIVTMSGWHVANVAGNDLRRMGFENVLFQQEVFSAFLAHVLDPGRLRFDDLETGESKRQ